MKMRFWVSLWLLLVLGQGCRAAPATVPATPLPTAALRAGAPAVENWDDRSLYKPGLIASEQKWLDGFKGASVYHIDLFIPEDYTTLQGRERVRYTNQEQAALDGVYFQLFPNLEGGKVSVANPTLDGRPVEVSLENGGADLRLALPGKLQPGQSVEIGLDFGVEVPTEAGGDYGLFGYSEQVLMLDGFYPAIPAYDEKGWHSGPIPHNADTTYQDASFYRVRVDAPSKLVIAASGVEVERANRDGRQVVTYAAGPARDFYLAGSEQFSVISQEAGETRVNSYATAEHREAAQLALDTAVAALKSYGQRLGPYPYREFDVVSTVPQGAMGIEYPGVVGITSALYDLKQESSGGVSPAVNLEATVAHESGHQWFYNLVGNDQYNNPWLDESLTQYLTGTYYLDRYGRSAFLDYRTSWTGRWARASRALIPIGLPAADYQGNQYSAIVYGRGPLFLEALAEKMGQPTFDAFLRDYVQTYHWSVADPQGFQRLAEQHCACDLKVIFDEWVNPQ